MAAGKKPRSTENSLAGWSDIIQRTGEEGRARELERRKRAADIIARVEPLALEDKVRVLLIGLDDGDLRVDEVLNTLREAVK